MNNGSLDGIFRYIHNFEVTMLQVLMHDVFLTKRRGSIPVDPAARSAGPPTSGWGEFAVRQGPATGCSPHEEPRLSNDAMREFLLKNLTGVLDLERVADRCVNRDGSFDPEFR